MKNIKMKKLNNRGMSMIIVSFLIMTFIYVSMGFVNIIQKTHIRNEIQGMMDNAGVLALRYAVDENKWRDEIIEVNEPTAKAKFVRIMNEQLSGDLKGLVDTYNIKEVNVYNERITSQGKGEYYIESVIEVDYNSVSWAVDKSSSSIHTFYNFFTGENDARMVSGDIEDGKGESVIRSVSRLVLR